MSPSAVADGPVINESELGSGLSVNKSNDDEQGLSIVGATASDEAF